MARIAPPPHLPIPAEFQKNRVTADFFKNLLFMIFQIWQKIGGAGDLITNFNPWAANVIYLKDNIVTGTDGNYYQLITDQSEGVNPVDDDGSTWLKITILGIYNPFASYVTGDLLYTSAGSLWRVIAPTSGINPADDNGTYYEPAIQGAKVPEIITLEERTTTVIAQTGGGTLTALRVNELQDGGAYTLPLASSVLANQVIQIDLPDEFKAFQPTVTRNGTDTISYSGGTDTSILFDADASFSITLTSNGVSEWRL